MIFEIFGKKINIINSVCTEDWLMFISIMLVFIFVILILK